MKKAQEELEMTNVNTDVATTTAPLNDEVKISEEKTSAGKPHGLIVAVVMTSILAIVGVAFGIYGMLRPVEPPVVPTNPEGTAQEEEQEIAGTPSVAEVTELLADKYGFKDAQGILFKDNLASSLDDFGLEAKLMLVAMSDGIRKPYEECDYRPEANSCVYTTSYDDFNAQYQRYFGGEDLVKTDYDLSGRIPYKLVYLADSDGFEIYFPDGIGGIELVQILSKVSNVYATDNGYTALVLTAKVNMDMTYESGGSVLEDGAWVEHAQMPEENLEAIQKSLTAYEFEFIVEDGESKLTEIQRI